MPRSFELTDYLPWIAPNALCDDCIRDRVPIWARAQIPRMMSELTPPNFERSMGECSACGGAHQVTRHIRNQGVNDDGHG
jgi:hypothetical protein